MRKLFPPVGVTMYGRLRIALIHLLPLLAVLFSQNMLTYLLLFEHLSGRTIRDNFPKPP